MDSVIKKLREMYRSGDEKLQKLSSEIGGLITKMSLAEHVFDKNEYMAMQNHLDFLMKDIVCDVEKEVGLKIKQVQQKIIDNEKLIDEKEQFVRKLFIKTYGVPPEQYVYEYGKIKSNCSELT